VPVHQPRPAVGDPGFLDLGQGVGVEGRAMRAGERGILEYRNRRLGRTQDPVVLEDFHFRRPGGARGQPARGQHSNAAAGGA